MILRKPYKLLIKFFKLIHIVMFLIFVYFAFILNNIYTFFSNYVKNGSFTYIENMASRYVPIYVFILSIIIIIMAVFIYSLMRQKEKPVLFYRILIGYGSLLTIMFVYIHSVFTSIDDAIYEPLRIVINRDISLAFYLINFFYVGFTFIRGFGFDIKKFSFDQDKKEMEIDETDNEEFEVNIDIDKDHINSRIKHEKRELKYYFRDNAKFFISVLLIALVVFGYKFYNKVFVENKVYQQGDIINLGNLSYKVNKSYILTMDKYSDMISSDNSFIVVDLNIKNNGNKVILHEETFRVVINSNCYYPVYNYYNSFSDLGNGLNSNRVINAESEGNYLLIFKVSSKDTGKMFFEILNNIKYYTFDKTALNPFKEDKKSHNITIKEEFTTDNFNLKIKEYSFSKKNILYNYQECNGDKCIELIKTIKPNLNEVILALEIENSEKLNDNFIEDYFGIIYDDINVSSKNISFLGQNNNKIYLSVPKGASYASNLTLTIKERNNEYFIKLKG